MGYVGPRGEQDWMSESGEDSYLDASYEDKYDTGPDDYSSDYEFEADYGDEEEE